MSGLEWQKDIVVILPTGSGKSAVVATVAKLETLKVTAVLCPLKSLLADWQRRLQRISFPFEVFSPSSPVITGQKPIVLVSLDATDRATWHQAVASLRPEIQLNRYVVDEAHLILTEASYREVMSHVKELRTHRAQLMLLSATIAPKSIPALRTAFSLAPGDLTRIIRASSNRPEFAFHMPNKVAPLDKTVSKIRNEMLMLNAEERVLVFVQKLDHGHVISAALGCEFYRGSTDTKLNDKQREAMVDHWHSGEYKVMVATDAFGPGNDYPHVRMVAFVGSPKGVVDMLQAAGRGGRDGRKVNILFFPLTGDNLPGTINDSHLGRDELAPVLKSPQLRCWRAVFTQFLDGVAHSCTQSDYNWKCPKCRGSSKLVRPAGWIRREANKTFHITPTLPPAPLILHSDILSPQVGSTRARAPSIMAPLPSSIGAVIGNGQAFAAQAQVAKRLRSDRDAQLQPLVDRVKAANGVLSGHCAFCHVYTQHAVVPKHEGGGIIRCPNLKELMKKTEGKAWKICAYYLDWKKLVKYQKGVQVCWKCHVPFLHDRLHAAKEGGVDGCNAGH
ncbi:P-loop containing nucleoside triphosphate hydrolase protein, partial [Pilatotrama ljubarskyi]